MLERGDLHLGERLAVAFLLVVAGLLAVLHDHNLVAETFVDDLCRDLRAGDCRSTNLYRGAVSNQKDRIEVDFGALTGLALDVLNGNNIAFFDDVLVGARLDYCYFCHIGARTIHGLCFLGKGWFIQRFSLDSDPGLGDTVDVLIDLPELLIAAVVVGDGRTKRSTQLLIVRLIGADVLP